MIAQVKQKKCENNIEGVNKCKLIKKSINEIGIKLLNIDL